MKRSVWFSAFVLLIMILSTLPLPTGAQEIGTTSPERASAPRVSPPVSLPQSAPAAQPNSPQQAGWQFGPPSPFHFQRFDGVFVPGPEPWGNKVYFMGGRTSSSTELPDIWVFDPLTGQYTDSQTNMIEDVCNYNANLVMDDGAGMGPAIYIIGGYDRDGGSGGGNLGMIQRYYPQFNTVEALPSADDWPVEVAGYKVGAMGTAVVDDIIYVFGGWESTVAPYFSNETWAFDPQQPSGSRWTNLSAPLATARCYIQSAAQNGKVYAMGGTYQYTGGDLVPTTAVEVLDTNNIAAGWQPLSPMPVAVAEGRGFGFDSDTLGGPNAPWSGYLYVAGGGDWGSSYYLTVQEYNIATDTWNQDFAEINEDRANPAGVFIPLCTPDPYDGLPGMWLFGGTWDGG